MLTIVVYYHRSPFRTFKHYYQLFICRLLKRYFPKLVSYTRFIELMLRLIIPLCVLLNLRKGECSGIAFMDATALRVCHNGRISQHKVFDGAAARGKCSTGWFFGAPQTGSSASSSMWWSMTEASSWRFA